MSRAVATLAIPTIISQVVTMIYNLADTFFIGQIGDPGMVAAVSLVSPWFNLLTALGNLFGLGGSSLISRMLGAKDHRDVKFVASFSIWGGAAASSTWCWTRCSSSCSTWTWPGPPLPPPFPTPLPWCSLWWCTCVGGKGLWSP